MQQPAAVQPAAQPVVQQSSHSEELLTKLLNQFSYDSMVQEIQRSVRAELEANRAAFTAAPAAPVVAYAMPPVAPPETYAAPMPVPPEEEFTDDPALSEADNAAVDENDSLLDDFDLLMGNSSDDVVELPLDEDDIAIPAAAFDMNDESEPEQPEEGFNLSLGSIFNEDAMAEAARLKAEEEKKEVGPLSLEDIFGQDEDGDSDELLSFESLFGDDDGDDEPEEENEIDLMPLYDKVIIEVSLEELAKYNIAHKL